MRFTCIARIVALTLWASAFTAAAHPVAQGSMQITLAEDRLKLRVSVTEEEVLIAANYAPHGGEHGAYLLEHFRVSADGQLLRGRLLPNESSPAPGAGRFIYTLEYPLATPAKEFRVEEDVLNEVDFAPGNRWEASYLTEIREENGGARAGLLLTSRQAIVFHREGNSAGARTPRLDRWQVMRDYCQHGILHILTGYDHLLFVTALVLAVRSLWELVKVISAFTLAHSITLTLSAFDLVRLPSRVVEPMIAASIVFVALQNIFWPRRTHGWSRLGIAFFFGLFHGLGFAGGLLEAMEGMATNVLVLALVGFSVGVEIGHQVVVLPTFGLLKIAGNRALERWGSVAIALAGAFYLAIALRG